MATGGVTDERWIIEKLDGEANWSTWKFQMKHLLLAKDLWGVCRRNGANTFRRCGGRGESGLSEQVTESVFTDCTGYNIFSALPGNVVRTARRGLEGLAEPV